MTRMILGGAAAAVLALAIGAAPAQALCSFNGLNGTWRGNDGGRYQVRQNGMRVWWTGMSGDGGRSWAHRFQGVRRGNTISGNWADFRGPMGRGTLNLRVVNDMRMVRVSNTGSGFGGSQWRRGCNDTVGKRSMNE